MSLLQEIQTTIKSDVRDWREYPGLGTDLDDFIGESNTEETAELIKSRIRHALTVNPVVASSDFAVNVVPISLSGVLIVLTIGLTSVNETGALVRTPFNVTLTYDYSEKGVYFVPGTSTLGG